MLNLSWHGVFISAEKIWYEISAGTYRGGANIVQWKETAGQNIQFGLPASITETAGIEIFVLIRAVVASGIYTDTDAFIKLPT